MNYRNKYKIRARKASRSRAFNKAYRSKVAEMAWVTRRFNARIARLNGFES